jgi:hypothetical protein
VLIALVAPVISMSGTLTTGLNGTSPAVTFPPGYGVSLAATVAATTVAAILAALIARRDALIAIPASLGLWAIIGVSVVAEGTQLGHTGLTGWGVDPDRRLGYRSSRPHSRCRPPPAGKPAAWPAHPPPACPPPRALRARTTVSWQAHPRRKALIWA